MKRYVSLEEISDGRLYSKNDMVRADCHGCQGCSACCRGMGKTIILDPYDTFRLTTGLGKSMEELLLGAVELNVVDGVILPNLSMQGEEDGCFFLDKSGRCSIHPYRPGICRLFPLGRYYENGSFHYFLQEGECREKHSSKIKISKWVDTERLAMNEQFVTKWHYLLMRLEEYLSAVREEDFARQLNMLLLKVFYLLPYAGDRDFYEQFQERETLFKQELEKITGMAELLRKEVKDEIITGRG